MWWYPIFHVLGFDYGLPYGHFCWYNLWSGIGGTLLFSALIFGPPWYWKRTCHDSWRCVRWGKYPAAGGLFRLCHRHHPDLMGTRPHRELIHRLHAEHKSRAR